MMPSLLTHALKEEHGLPVARLLLFVRSLLNSSSCLHWSFQRRLQASRRTVQFVGQGPRLPS